ncbi:beta-ketoacyl reductase, partial [Streptomyces sp. NPDC052020]|uniref:acyl carrier protein n=1 Tax=Streptomyces sp. NPDC052020 TaxID=3155677 RepID=UPI00341D914A
HRRTHGLPAHSLGWGLWNTGQGMAAGLTRSDLERLGGGALLPLTTAQNLALFDAALATRHPALLPVKVNPGRPTPPLTDNLRAAAVTAPARPAARTAERAAPADLATLEQRLAPLAEDERLRLLEDVIGVEVAAVLGHADAAAVDPARTFQESGFDSLTAVELRNRLKKTTGQRLPATLIFDYPTPQALAESLLEELSPALEEIAASARSAAAESQGAADADEDALRRVLASVPLARVREAGLLDALLALAPAGLAADGPEAAVGLVVEEDQSDAILAMDIDDLIREAFERSDAEQPE